MKKNHIFSIQSLLLFLFVSLLLSFSSFALDIPPVPSTYVSDFAKMLSPATHQFLEGELAKFERETTNQVLVATFPDLQGVTIEDFSIRLAEKWKPGQTGRDNGVILVVSKGDRAVRIEVGYGLEGVLTDALSKSILENEIIPDFKNGNFDQGILRGVEAIKQATQGEYQAKATSSGSGLTKFIFILFIFLFFLVPLFVLITVLGNKGKGFRSGGSYRGYGGSSGWSSGSSWGGSSGGFSSGGGSFGGGGASGRW